MERALCVARGEALIPEDLPPEVRGGGQATPEKGGFDEQLERLERGLLQQALEGAGGSQKQAAQALGLTYDRFRHLLRKHGLIGG